MTRSVVEVRSMIVVINDDDDDDDDVDEEMGGSFCALVKRFVTMNVTRGFFETLTVRVELLGPCRCDRFEVWIKS
jgi:hypothetical protein